MDSKSGTGMVLHSTFLYSGRRLSLKRSSEGSVRMVTFHEASIDTWRHFYYICAKKITLPINKVIKKWH